MMIGAKLVAGLRALARALNARAGLNLFALIAGLALGNLFPGFTASIREAVRPELYIKTAIVILGGFLGELYGLPLLFAVSGGGRLAAGLLFLAFVKERLAKDEVPG